MGLMLRHQRHPPQSGTGGHPAGPGEKRTRGPAALPQFRCTLQQQYLTFRITYYITTFRDGQDSGTDAYGGLQVRVSVP